MAKMIIFGNHWIFSTAGLSIYCMPNATDYSLLRKMPKVIKFADFPNSRI